MPRQTGFVNCSGGRAHPRLTYAMAEAKISTSPYAPCNIFTVIKKERAANCVNSLTTSRIGVKHLRQSLRESVMIGSPSRKFRVKISLSHILGLFRESEKQRTCHIDLSRAESKKLSDVGCDHKKT